MAMITTTTSDDFRTHRDDYLDHTQHAGDRTLITRDGRGIAAIISTEDLELLLALEDRTDGAAAEEALREAETPELFAWDQIR